MIYLYSSLARSCFDFDKHVRLSRKPHRFQDPRPFFVHELHIKLVKQLRNELVDLNKRQVLPDTGPGAVTELLRIELEMVHIVKRSGRTGLP